VPLFNGLASTDHLEVEELDGGTSILRLQRLLPGEIGAQILPIVIAKNRGHDLVLPEAFLRHDRREEVTSRRDAYGYP
jgi:hypothetical protein